jgi:hypothetical protein
MKREQKEQAAIKWDFVHPKGLGKSTIAAHFKVTLNIVLWTRWCAVYFTDFLNFETDLSDTY